jgi:hypothetical protein
MPPGDAAVKGFHADDGHHVFRRYAGFPLRLLQAGAMLHHELSALLDALLGHEPGAVFVPGGDTFGRLGDQLDDLGLRLGLGEQAVDIERLELVRGGGGFDELADLGAIQIEARAALERAIRQGGTRYKSGDQSEYIRVMRHEAMSFRWE